MGVYLNTFRTAHKVADFNGQPVKVYSWQFCCRAGDEDTFMARNDTRARRIQANIKLSSDKFDEHKPKFIVDLHADHWEGSSVYADPTSAVYYDSDKMPVAGKVGFLVRKAGKGWVISDTRHGSDKPMVCGLTVVRQWIEKLVDGQIQHTNLSYTFSNGTVFNETQFQSWKAENEPKYVAACLQRQEEYQKQQAEAAAARKAKLDSKDAEISAAQENLNRLRQERTTL